MPEPIPVKNPIQRVLSLGNFRLLFAGAGLLVMPVTGLPASRPELVTFSESMAVGMPAADLPRPPTEK